MNDEVFVILDLSTEVKALLDRQRVDLYRELQREIPSLRLSRQAGPTAATGSRDLVTVISVTTTLVATLTSAIIKILTTVTPPNRTQTYIIEEGEETLHSDGRRTINKKYVLAKKEHRFSDSPSAQPSPDDGHHEPT